MLVGLFACLGLESFSFLNIEMGRFPPVFLSVVIMNRFIIKHRFQAIKDNSFNEKQPAKGKSY